MTKTQNRWFLAALLSMPLVGISGGIAVFADETNTVASVTVEALPRGVASFGATRVGDWLYVYSGHTGKTHVYSKEDMLPGFYRVSVTKGGAWESLPFPEPAQGVALIADNKLVYRMGGMQARNEKGADADLYSLDSVASFDPATKTWADLPKMPTPRSSHRAAVVGNKLYVFGGWSIVGGETGDWMKEGLVLDLANQDQGWRKFPQPAERRALDVVAARGKIWMIGGLTPDDEVSDEVHVFDIETEKWELGPKLPGPLPIGNGIAAIASKDDVFVSGMDGKVYKLDAEASSWTEAGKLPSGRIHHRMVSLDDGSLVTVGGSSRQGHIALTDFIKLAN
ncbi:MAG: Kelch repeat-containing protein [Pirellula sp.]|jgi:N-acetylneuraminic acid mutarotase